MPASLSTKAQGIYQNWGVTRDGGPDNVGVIFTSDSGGGGIANKHSFTLTNKGGSPQGAMTAYNSKLYGVAQTGGAGNKAMIYSYDPATSAYAKVVDITGPGVGDYGQASDLTLYNGAFYGTTNGDNATNFGAIFKYDLSTNAFSTPYNFNGTDGSGPIGTLTLDNNYLYGVTAAGGPSGMDYGVIFKFDPSGAASSIPLIEFTPLAGIGNTPTGSLTLYNNKLYGTTRQSISGGDGSVFEFDIASTTFTNELQLHQVNSEAVDNGSLVLYNSKLYGLAPYGGSDVIGALFEYDPAFNSYTIEHNFASASKSIDGSLPQGGLVASGTKLIGLTYADGANGLGTLFEFDLATPSGVYTKTVDFNGTNGASSYSTLTDYSGILYGTTKEGGSTGMGVIFEYDPSTPTYAKKVDFGTSTAANPSSSLTYYNKIFYGTTQKGGASGLGSIYKYDKATNTTTILYSFNGTDGSYPMGDLVMQGGKFYAMTIGGGTPGKGVIFSFDPATSTYAKLYEFALATGGNVDISSAKYISSPLAFYNGKFYGTTYAGGVHGDADGGGVLFSFDPATNAYLDLYDFDDGSDPTGGLTELNGKVYGLTVGGGVNGQGNLFSFDPSGGYANLHDFAAPDYFLSQSGELSPPGLTVANGKLYGVSYWGGDEGAGFLFEYDPSGGGYSKKFSFDDAATPGVQGAEPTSKLMERNGLLYGMTYVGGANGAGVIYKFDPATSDYTRGGSFTSATTGTGATGTSLVSVPAPVADGGNCVPIASSNVTSTGWKGIIDASGAAIAEVNPNGNSLTSLAADLYVQSSPERQYKGYSFLNRSITITVGTQPTSAVDLRLYVKKSEVDDLMASPTSGVTSPNDIAIFKSEDPCNNGAIGSDLVKLTTNWTTWEDDYVFTTQVSSFSTFHLASSTIALPITLLDFTANRKTKNEVLLNWSTSTEINSDYFNIERSEDALHFATAGKVAAAGTSSLKRSYLFTDMYSSNNDVYYRLKMVDKDGSYKYSKTVKVSGAATTVSISPNPAHNTLTITGARFTQLQIIDATGQLVKQFGQLSGNQYDISNLQQGMYTLRFINGTTVTSSKFIKL
ncbi:MAG: T9SS type A sorting domain-containing protein [Chitinophagaceae bacterium]